MHWLSYENAATIRFLIFLIGLPIAWKLGGKMAYLAWDAAFIVNFTLQLMQTIGRASK